MSSIGDESHGTIGSEAVPLEWLERLERARPAPTEPLAGMTSSTMSDTRFRDRVVLVTGVGRAGQIGHAVALAFGQAGARLVAADLDAVGVSRRVREFQAAGIDAQPTAGDLTIPDIAALAVETAIRNYGRLDAVINVAGGLTTFGPIARPASATSTARSPST